MRNYFYRVMIAVSMLLNVIMGGSIGQTLSARHWERKRNGKWHLVRIIDKFLGRDHCMHCWAYWMVRKW